MRVLRPSYEILYIPPSEEILRIIELAGRTCYKSEDKISEVSAGKFIKRILDSGHESVIEHLSCSVRFICDRGVSHELVRHRLAAYSQESTRYANYSKNKFGNEITVIQPFFWSEDSEEYRIWQSAMQNAENAYMDLLQKGASPQQARSVLPNSLKTEIVMSCNFREWRHVFSLRCSRASHPQIQELMLQLLPDLHSRIPILFDDIYQQYQEEISKFQRQDC